MKSFSNGNFQFYENLHKKYFDKAKEHNHVSTGGGSKTKEKSEGLSGEGGDKDLFNLTSKTGGTTILGLSQLKQSIDSLKTSSRLIAGAHNEDSKQRSSSVLRASSLNTRQSQVTQ